MSASIDDVTKALPQDGLLQGAEGDGKRIEVFAANAKPKRFAWSDATCSYVQAK